MTIQWSYALNQWKGTAHDRFVLRSDHERALKTVAISGFSGVEIAAGTGRWEPLGRKDTMELHYGSVAKFRNLLQDCAIAAVSSYYYDPGQRIVEEDKPMGRSVLVRSDHAGIEESIRQYAELLTELGGNCVVVRAMPAWAADRSLSSETIGLAADCWNRVGAMLGSYGLGLAIHPDALSMLRTADDIGALLDACDPKTVGLSFDTAEVTIAGLDALALYQRFASRVRHLQFKDTRVRDEAGEYRLPHAEHAMMMSGGARRIERWFWEMGTEGGLVDFPALHQALVENRYDGWVVVECEQSPEPASSTMLNGWYLQRVLRQSASAA